VAVGLLAFGGAAWRARRKPRPTTYGSARWTDVSDVAKAGLHDGRGVVVGLYPGSVSQTWRPGIRTRRCADAPARRRSGGATGFKRSVDPQVDVYVVERIGRFLHQSKSTPELRVP